MRKTTKVGRAQYLTKLSEDQREKIFNRLNFYNDYYQVRKLHKQKEQIKKEVIEDRNNFKPKVIQNYDKIKNKKPFSVTYGKNNFKNFNKKKKDRLDDFMRDTYGKFIIKKERSINMMK